MSDKLSKVEALRDNPATLDRAEMMIRRKFKINNPKETRAILIAACRGRNPWSDWMLDVPTEKEFAARLDSVEALFRRAFSC